MRLDTMVNALYRALYPSRTLAGAPKWFHRELTKRGIIVSRQTVRTWLNVEVPEARRSSVDAVMRELHQEAHDAVLASLKALPAPEKPK